LLALFLSGCSIFIGKPVITKETSLKKLKTTAYPDFSDYLRYADLAESINQSLSYLRRIPADRLFYFGKDTFTTPHIIRTLERFLDFIQTNPSESALNRFIAGNFLVYQSVGSNRKKEILFTGYYEPTILGSLQQDDTFQFPIYTIPSDLITIDLSPFAERFKGEKIVGRYNGRTVVPYYERREIQNSTLLKEKTDVLAWIKDPIDLFFLQIQGSGKIQLTNGNLLNVHYHASNGRPYRSIGRLLIDEGKIPAEEMSMQKIRSYLNANPHEIEHIFNHNPSYVFFKLEEDGPLGYLQVKLTGTRSVALDRKIYPLASLAFIESLLPLVDAAGMIEDWSDFSGFVLNQDTGGAIRGPGRADLFWGNGPYAEIAAGHMQHPGKLYFLVLKPNG
jgi:membrane-bound lytic murein transglycosylase A